MKKEIVVISIIILLMLTISTSAYSSNPGQSGSGAELLRDRITALDITKTKSLKKLSVLDEVQNKTLYHEYTVFIEYLTFKISEYCEQLAENFGEKSLKDLPCYIAYQRESLDKKQYITDKEQIDSLDNELMTALGNFDEMLLAEEEILAQSSRKNSQSGSSSAAGNKSSNSDNNAANNGAGKKDSAQNKTSSTNKNKASGKGANKQSSEKTNQSAKGKKGRKNKNRKRLDQIDDDIVARQLKEAAEQEIDPELKEKLWDEYYKYKQNTVK